MSACVEPSPVVAGPAGERPAEVEVGGLREVAVAAQAPDAGQVRRARAREEVLRLAAVDLGRGLQEEQRVREQPGQRQAGVGDPLFAAQQVLRSPAAGRSRAGRGCASG